MSDKLGHQVDHLQSALAREEADHIYWQLEWSLLPNQVLREGCRTLTELLLAGLPDATNSGRVATWELLAQLAAGACHPTAARAHVVAEVREVLRDAVCVAIATLDSQEGHQSGYQIVDVLDAFLTFGAPPETDLALAALRRFGTRGPNDARRVRSILEACPTGCTTSSGERTDMP